MSYRSFYSFFAVIFVLAVGSVSAQQKLPDGVKKITSAFGITEYRLDNGLKILLQPEKTSNSILVNVTYQVGSRHEGYGETGMAHLLEHLLFKGSTNHPSITEEMSSHGASANGSTNVDRTNYYESFSATDKNLNWALSMEADRMVNSFIAKKDLDTEFSVVRNELESRANNNGGLLNERVLAAAYVWHNYGKSTIGSRSDLENVPIERIKAFYKKYYQPDNAYLIVTGKIDERKTLGLIKKYFGAIPRPERKLVNTYTVEPVQDGENQVVLRRKGGVKIVSLNYHVSPAMHKDIAAVEVMNKVMRNAPTGALYKAFVETKKATSVFGRTARRKEPGITMFGVLVPKDGSIKKVRDEAIEVIENYGKTTPSKEEVERAKLAYLTELNAVIERPRAMATAISGAIAVGDWRQLFLFRDWVKEVTPEDVQRVARKYLVTSNRTVGLAIPTESPVRADIPTVTDEQIAALLKNYKGGAAVSEGEVFDPTVKNILTRTTFGNVGGLKTAFLSKKTRADGVVAKISLRFGNETSLMNKGLIGDFTSRLIDSGTKNKTRPQIRDALNKLGVRVLFFGGADGFSATLINAKRDTLPAILELVAEIIKDASFPEDEFEKYKKRRISGLNSVKDNPSYLLKTAMGSHFNIYPKGHIFYERSHEELVAQIEALKVEDLRNFHREFYGASKGELFAVGDFDEKEITRLAAKLFGNWKSKTPYKQARRRYGDVEPINHTIETPDKPNANFGARLNLNIQDDHPDYPALLIANRILGGGSLSSRLGVRIRQKEGLSYGVRSRLTVNDQTGSVYISAIYAPQNRDKVETAFREEVSKFVKDGVTENEFKNAKTGWLQRRRASRGSDRGIFIMIEGKLRDDRAIGWNYDFEKKIEALTVKQVNDVIRKYISLDKFSIIKAGDFAKAMSGMEK